MGKPFIALEPEKFTPKDIELSNREGIFIEKGAILTSDFLEQHEDLIKKYIEYFSAYPDAFLDLIAPKDSNFSLFLYQRILLRAIMRYQQVYVTACVKPNTPVLTERGMIPIQDIDVNDKVWSDGTWRTIENLNIHNWNGNLVKLTAENCFEDTIVVTDDHKFLTVPKNKRSDRPGIFWKEGIKFFQITNYKQRCEFYRVNLREVTPKFVEAKNLTNNDWLLSSIDTTINDIEKINIPTIPPRTKNTIQNNQVLLDKEFFEWMGIWLAEGSWRNSTISFTIALQEERLRDRIIELTKHCYGLQTHITTRPEKNTQILYIYSAHLDIFMQKLFGCQSKDINQWNKWIPSILLHCDPHKQLQLVKGWLDGDGYYRKMGNCHRYKGTTVSNVLCEGLKMCLYRNYINPSITTENRKNKAKVYNINFNGPIANEFENAINENRCVVVDETMRLGEYYPILCNGKLYMRNKVREIEILKPDHEDVYCLQMSNGIFNLNGVESHNCRAFSKSFISILAMMLQCIFMPNTKRFICAPAKNQSAQIAREKIIEIYDRYPLLMGEIEKNNSRDVPGNFSKDAVTLKFKNGSTFDVVGARDTQRGGRRHGGLIDEIRKIFLILYTLLDEILLINRKIWRILI